MTAVSVDLGSGTSVSTSASIGVDPHSNWQQESGFPTFTSTNLEDDTTAATTLDLEFSSSGSGNLTTNATGSGDLYDMFTRGVRVPQTSSASLIFSEIPYSSYDLYLYIAETDTASGDLYEFSDGTTTYYFESQGTDNFNSGTLARVSSTSSISPSTSGNYVLFEGLSSASVTITATSPDSNEMAMVGLQVVEASSGNTNVSTSSQSLAFSENPASIFLDRNVGALTESLSLSLYSSTISTGGPVITDVNTTESWGDGDTGLIITGSGFV